MAASGLSLQRTEPTPVAEAVRLVDEARKLIAEFLRRERNCPDRAWESVVQLKALVVQLQELRPAHSFRTKLKGTEPDLSTERAKSP